MTYSPATLIEVTVWGRTVGAVALDPDSNFYAFEYDAGWLESGPQLSPILMENRPGVFVFPTLDPLTFQRLPPMLADSLPDRFGNALVDAWMAEQGVGAGEISALDRLAYAANRAMGALEFRPPAQVSSTASVLQVADLVTAARSTVSGDLENAPHDALRQLIQVGTSAGGARAKAVIAYQPATGQMRSGQTAAPKGYEHWLIKFDGVSGDPTREPEPFVSGEGYGRIEYAYYLMATAAGLQMSESRLLIEDARAHFMTKRFDRTGDTRVHVQTLCGLAALDFNQAGAHSYAQFFGVIEKLGLGSDTYEQAFRRVVFNVAAANRDDHTKNLAFDLPEGREWSLAPAYDITHAHNPDGLWTSRHQMSVNGKREGINAEDLIDLGDRYGVPRRRDLLAEVLEAVDRWPEFAEAAGVGSAHTARIAADLADCRPVESGKISG